MNAHYKLQIISHLNELDKFNRIKSWSDIAGQHWVKFDGLTMTDAIPIGHGDVQALETTLTEAGWQVIPSLSVRGNFRAVKGNRSAQRTN